jgi:hypothetical protein
MNRTTVAWFGVVSFGAWLFSLAGCGRVRADKPSGCSRISGHKPANLLVLGNSITHAPADPAVGWYGNWGMAAPTAATDFSHLTASAMQLPVTTVNLSIETEPETSGAQISAIASTVAPDTAVVLEFGDDVPGGGLDSFAAAYDQLAGAVAKGDSLVCVSTWWEEPNIDNAIRVICGKHDGCYAYIGDLHADPANTDLQTVEYSDPHINSHPRQWGHQHIAERVFAPPKNR